MKKAFDDVWLFRQDFDLNDVVLQENETFGAMWTTKSEIIRMNNNGKLVPFSYMDELFEKAGNS